VSSPRLRDLLCYGLTGEVGITHSAYATATAKEIGSRINASHTVKRGDEVFRTTHTLRIAVGDESATDDQSQGSGRRAPEP
jgi:hypothetical protein